MQTEPRLTDVLALAFLGDALYELAVRERILGEGKITRADKLHKEAVRYVCAPAQAAALLAMMDEGFFTEEEDALIRRAHNHKIATKPKNADPVTYKWATAFEALLGFLDLSGRKERLEEVMQKAMSMTDAPQESKA